MSSFSHNSWNIDKCSYFTLYHCVYVMVTTSCLGDSLKNTRLRCDKPFLWTIIRCHAMKTSCIIATEHKYELNSVLLTSRILNFWLKYYGNRIQNLLMILRLCSKSAPLLKRPIPKPPPLAPLKTPHLNFRPLFWDSF